MTEEDLKLAEYIFEWLRERNGGELDESVSSMTVASYERAIGELAMILANRGKPPNWTG